jgi:hypothetical protein
MRFTCPPRSRPVAVFALALTLLLNAGSSTVLAQQTPAQPATTPAAAPPVDTLTIRLGTNTVTTFYPASVEYLTRAYVKLTGVDLGDDKLIDEFSAVNYCDLYTRLFKDEFTWRQAREAVRKTIQRDLESYPETFFVDGQIQLGRYNFETKAFDIEERSKFRRTGVINVVSHSGPKCLDFAAFRTIPVNYKFRLTNPITLEFLPVSEAMAGQIARLMEEQGNKERVVNVTFFMRINDFSNTTVRNQSRRNDAGEAESIANSTIRATLLSMRIYLDEEHKAMIYEYKSR